MLCTCIGILYRVVHNRRNFQVRDLWEVALTPREITRALEPSLGIAISIVNPNFSFSVSGTMNVQPVMFLVDIGSALTILHRDTWKM